LKRINNNYESTNTNKFNNISKNKIKTLSEDLTNNLKINDRLSKEVSKIYKEVSYNYFGCVPHEVTCNMNLILSSKLISNPIKIPLFITYDCISEGYRIEVDSQKLLLTDDLVSIRKQIKSSKPLYYFSPFDKFEVKQSLYETYFHYLTYKNIQYADKNIKSLDKSITISRNNIPKFRKRKKIIIEYINSLDYYGFIKQINEKKFNSSKKEFLKYLNDKLNIKIFIEFATSLNNSMDEIKEYLNSYFKNNKSLKQLINDEFSNNDNNENNNNENNNNENNNENNENNNDNIENNNDKKIILRIKRKASNTEVEISETNKILIYKPKRSKTLNTEIETSENKKDINLKF